MSRSCPCWWSGDQTADRDANSALWRITLARIRWHQPTKDYVTRRTAEGKTKIEIVRCLKRYIARETFHLLASPPLDRASLPGATATD